MEIFFPEATQPSWKITEIPSRRGGGGGDDNPPQETKSALREEIMDTFWNYTLFKKFWWASYLWLKVQI